MACTLSSGVFRRSAFINISSRWGPCDRWGKGTGSAVMVGFFFWFCFKQTWQFTLMWWLASSLSYCRSRDKRGVISLAVKHRKQPSAKPNRLHFEFRDANTTAMNFCWTFVNCILMLLSVGYMNGRQCPFSVRLMVSSSACLTHILVLVLSINATVEFHYKDLSHWNLLSCWLSANNQIAWLFENTLKIQQLPTIN